MHAPPKLHVNAVGQQPGEFTGFMQQFVLQDKQILAVSHLKQFRDEEQVTQPTLLIKLHVDPD